MNMSPAGHPRPSRAAIAVAVVGITLCLMGCALQPDALLDRLMAQPISPEQHRELANEYRRRADDTRARAAYHGALASQYRGEETWPRDKARSGKPRDAMAEHCSALAEAFDAAALEYDALAAEHDAHADAGTREPRTSVGGQAPF